MATHHTLPASPQTCHWGFFDAALQPVLTVASGDTVTLASVSGGPDVLPQGQGFEILPEHRDIHRALEPKLGAHILTGPIAVDGALPGDVLQIDILSIQPRQFGGNIDLKELVAGTTLYLPIWAPGGLFSAGDGHGVQGDGEVCVTALETALSGTFRLTLRRDLHFALPRAETPSHWITMGFDEDLDDAAKIALRQMLDLIGERLGLGREDAYMFASLAVDLRVTQLVDGNKGIHALLAKRHAGARKGNEKASAG